MRGSRETLKFIAFVVLMAVFLIGGRAIPGLDEPNHWRVLLVERSPVLASSIFILVYVVGTFFMWIGPKDVLRVVSALVFGAEWSALLVYIGEMMNLLTMFGFSRKMGRAFVEQRLRGRMRELDARVSSTRSATIFFMKFYPYVSFRVLDLGYGLSRISLPRYFCLSALAAPVRIYVIQYFLALGLGTAFNVAHLQNYLLEHPRWMVATTVYIVSSWVYLAVLAFTARRRARATQIPG